MAEKKEVKKNAYLSVSAAEHEMIKKYCDEKGLKIKPLVDKMVRGFIQKEENE